MHALCLQTITRNTLVDYLRIWCQKGYPPPDPLKRPTVHRRHATAGVRRDFEESSAAGPQDGGALEQDVEKGRRAPGPVEGE